LSYTPMFFVSLRDSLRDSCASPTSHASYRSIAFSQLLEGLRR